MPHIGRHGRYRFRPPNHTTLPDPAYDYYEESLLMLDRLGDSASNRSKWDKIAFLR